MYLGPGIGLGRRKGALFPYVNIPFGVPPVAYQKAGSSFIIQVDPGDAWTCTVNGQTYATGVGTGTDQFVTGLLTRAMVANPATYLVTTSRGASASATGVVWGPDLLGAQLLAWYDETSAYSAAGWESLVGGAALTMIVPGGKTLPAVGDYLGRATKVTNGTTDLLARVFANAQPCGAHFAGKWTGAPTAGNKTLVGGGGTGGGQIFRTVADNILCLFSGATLAGPTSALTDRWLIAGGISNGASSKVWENGVLLLAGNAGANGTGGCSVGGTGTGTNLAAGEVGEIVQNSGVLAAPVLANLQAYLSAAWPI